MGQVLNSTYKMKVVGLESNSQRSESAMARNAKVISKRNYSLSSGNASRSLDINNITLRINDSVDSYLQLTKLIEDLTFSHCSRSNKMNCQTTIDAKNDGHNNESDDIPCGIGENFKIPICLVGLHCCGDLTPNILRYFNESCPFSGLLICVSCCYHSMAAIRQPLGNI